MSFTTGAPQRRGTRAATQGTSFHHVFASQTPYPKSDNIKQPDNANRATAKKRRVASIGDDTATGLVIHGQTEMDTAEGTDPDSATPPLAGDALYNPDFPISYNGRGTMRFVSPVKMPSVLGDMNVTGNVYSSAGLLGGVPDEVGNWTVQVGATGAGSNFTEDAANTYATYIRIRDAVHLHLHYTWSAKPALSGTDIYVKGLPYTLESQVHKAVIHCTGITPEQVGSYFIVEGAAGADEFQLRSAGGGPNTEVDVTGSECGSTGTISFDLSYHAVIP